MRWRIDFSLLVSKRIAERVWQIFVGLVLFLTGVLGLYGLHHFKRSVDDSWSYVLEMGFVIEAYSIVASLFILLGLRYIFGPLGFIERCLTYTTKHFLIAVILLSVVIAVASLWLLR